MRTLRASAATVWVAILTCAGLLLTSAPAWADPGDVRLVKIDNGFAEDTYLARDAYNKLMADLAECGDNGLCGEQQAAPFPVLEPLLEKIGTPQEVQSGTKAVGKACKTGYGCVAGVGFLAMLQGVNSLVDTWGPWAQTDDFNPLLSQHAAYYPSGKLSKCAALNSWDPNSPANLNMDQKGFSASGTVTSAAFIWNCQSSGRLATDCHKDGQWVHHQIAWNIATGGVGSTANVGASQICNTTIGNTPGWEVRRIHFDQTMAGDYEQNQGFDKGFYWGQNVIPQNGSLESLTRCKRPDGSVYEKVLTEPVSTGLTAVPACNAGDEPVYTQQTLIHPGGERELQTSQKLDTTADANQALSSCMSGCKFMVKMDGVTCQSGMAACVNWAQDKASATCWYGPYQLPLASCHFLERAYEANPQEVPLTGPNTDGDPNTGDGPQRQLQPASPSPTATVTTTTGPTSTTSPSASPSPSGSGQPNPSSSPTGSANPDPSSSASPSSSPSPSSSSSTTPGPTPCTAGQACDTPPASDADSGQCFPSGWAAFNPVQWVVKPIRCTLEPDPDLTRARVETVKNTLTQTGPGPIIVAVATVADSVPAEGGCLGPAIPFTLKGVNEVLHPFAACDEPMSTAAGYSKALASLVVIIGGGLAIVRAVGSGFGWSFSMRGGGGSGD